MTFTYVLNKQRVKTSELSCDTSLIGQIETHDLVRYLSLTPVAAAEAAELAAVDSRRRGGDCRSEAAAAATTMRRRRRRRRRQR